MEGLDSDYIVLTCPVFLLPILIFQVVTAIHDAGSTPAGQHQLAESAGVLAVLVARVRTNTVG
jgi:hypothetical protein